MTRVAVRLVMKVHRIALVPALLAVFATTVAHASTSRPRARPKPGAPVGGKLAHAVLEAIDDEHAILTFVLTTTAAGARELIVPIELPEGMIATGLSVAMGKAPADSAVPVVARAARGTYDRIVEQIRDPALLEWMGDERLKLSVFPVVKGVPARVTIELTTTPGAASGRSARVDQQMSLLAAPGIDWSDPYANYWPGHPSDDVLVFALAE